MNKLRPFSPFLIPLTFRGRRDPVLHRGLDRVLVVVRVLHLLAAVAQVPQDAHAVLHDLVADVGLLDRRTHYVEQRVHQALALTQILARVLARARHVPQNAGRVPKYRRPARLTARRARVPAAVRYDYVVHHHRHAVVDDRPLQVLKTATLELPSLARFKSFLMRELSPVEKKRRRRIPFAFDFGFNVREII